MNRLAPDGKLEAITIRRKCVMATTHREVYQPSFDDGPAYDYRQEEVEDARARLPLLIVISLLVLASFAGVVWLAYNQGIERGLVAAPTVIAAPETPIRTLPSEDDPSVAYTGLKIYDTPVPPDQEAAASALAPQPEPAPQVAALSQPEPAPAPAPPPAAPAVAVPAPAPAPVSPPAPAAAPAPVVSAPVATGASLLQVGAFPSQVLADEAWRNFQAQFPVIATGLSPNVQAADLGERGTWYRVRIGPFADDAAASAACEQLKAAGGNCFLAAP